MGKDFDDIVSQYGSKFNLEPIPESEHTLKATYSFEELWEKRDEEQKFLVPELLPAQTVAVLIGEDGIGKTQITTQLCLAIAMKHKTFLGLDLNAEKNKCLIVATEDSRQKFTSAIIKQAINLKDNINPKEICIKFTEGSLYDDWNSLKAEIETVLGQENHDLLVIDALSDLFTLIDGEINSNSDARRILSSLQAIASKHEVTVLIIHHAAKTKLVEKKKAGKLFVEKSDSQGAGAITQKPRTILALTNDPGSIAPDGMSYTNYLHVIKANLMSKHYMTNAIQCKFDSKSLLHHFVTLTDIETFENPGGSEDQFEKGRQASKKPAAPEPESFDHKMIVCTIFNGVSNLSRTALVEQLKTRYGVGKNKIEEKEGILNHLLSIGYISNDAGKFNLKIENYLMPTKDIDLSAPDEDDIPF